MHKYFVFVTSYFVNFFIIALVFNMGKILPDIIETFNSTRAESAVIHSTAIGVGSCSGFLAGFLLPVFGTRRCGILFTTLNSVGILFSYFATKVWHMTITFGVVHGLGNINSLICCTMAISQHFTGKKRLFLLSLHGTSAGIGSMAFSYVLQYLSSLYGFRGAMLIIGGICLNSIPCCFIWSEPMASRKKAHHELQGNQRRVMQSEDKDKATDVESRERIRMNAFRPEDKTTDIINNERSPVSTNEQTTNYVTICQRTESSRDDTEETEKIQSLCARLNKIFRNKYFVIFCFGSALSLTSLNIIIIFIADIFSDQGLRGDDATLGLFLLNIFTIIGRIAPGLIMQISCAPVFLCPLLATILANGTMVGLLLETSRWVTMMLCAITGVSQGMFIAMISIVTSRLVGTQSLSTSMGIIFTITGILSSAAGPISGHVRDTLASHHVTFYVSLGITGLWIVLYVCTLLQGRKETVRC